MSDSLVLTDCFIKIDEAEYSGKNTNVALSFSANAVDITAMGTGFKIATGGIKDWSYAMEFLADESTVGDLFAKVGEVVEVEVRATSAVRSVTNPSYVGTGLITEYSPLSGGVGDAHKVSLSIVSAGPLERLTVVTP